MGIGESVRVSLEGLRANKMRSLLTMLGIIIGIAAVIGILTVGNGLTGSITGSMSSLGATNITVFLQEKAGGMGGMETILGVASPEEEDLITDEMLEALRRYVQEPDVVFAYKYITEEAPAKVVKKTMSQKNDAAGASGARPRKGQRKKKRRSVFIPVLLGITVAFALACGALCFMMLRNANSIDQKANIELEDFVGMTRAEAEASAQISGGQINVEWVEEYSSTYGAGYIYKQSPTGGRNIREGQTVTLTVSLGTQYVAIPDVTNYVQADAEQLLRDSNLSVLVVQNVEPSVAVGAVIRTDPAAGTTVPAGSTVVVYVSRQQVATTTTVPSVVGLTVDDARSVLVQNRLTLGSQTQAYSDQPEGTVIAQGTAAGTTVKFNTRVNVTVSAGPEPAPEVPEAPSVPGGDWWSDLWGGGQSSSSSSTPTAPSEGGGSSSEDPGFIWPWDWFNGGGQ